MLRAGWRAVSVWRAALREDRRQRRGAPRRSREALEFLPAALEIMDTPPSPLRRWLALTIVAFVLAALAWSWFGRVDVVAVAPGKIIPSGRTKVIQPTEIGVVRAIRVRDGQHVRRGELLIDLDPTVSAADRDRLSRELASVRLDATRLRAALQGPGAPDAFVPPNDVDVALVARHRALLAAQLHEHEARLSAIDRDLVRRQSDRAAVQAVVEKLEKTIPLVRDRADSHGILARQGFVARLAHVELQQLVIEQEQELATQRHRLAESTAALAMLAEQRRHVEAEFRRAVLAQLAEAEVKAGSLEQEVRKAEQRHGLQRLVAPHDGVAQQLAVHTVGGVVTPAQPLLVIVPAGGGLEIEAVVLNRDAGFVRAGQDAEIKLETFPFTRYGTVPGRVLHVSGDAVHDEKLGLVYPVRVSMSRTTVDVEGKRVPVAPGMAVIVEVNIDQRRLIEYLLSPVLRYKQESFRER